MVLAADNSTMDQTGNVSQQIVLNAGTLQTGASGGAGVFGGGSSYLTSLQLNGGTLQLTNATGLTYQNNVAVSGNVLVISDRGVAGAGVTNIFNGTFSLGGTLFDIGNILTTSGAAGLSFGATTLTGNSMILSGAYGTGNLITLSSLDGSGVNANLVLGGNGGITVTGTTNLGTGKLTVNNNGGTTTFGGAIVTTGTVVLNNGTTGNVTLGGAGATSAAFVGAQSITVNGGTLQLGAAAASGTVDRISDTATLTLAGGNLLVSQLSWTSKESIGALSLGVGISRISQQAATSNGVGYYYLAFGNLGTVATGGMLDFIVAGTGTSNGSVQFSGTAPTLTNGILGAWATAGNDFATVSATGANVVAYAAYTTGSNDFSGTALPVNNYKLTMTSGTTVTLAGNSTINSLNLGTTAAGVDTLNLGGNTLDIITGGIIGQGNSGAFSIVNGTLTAGTTSAASELVYTVNTTQNVNIGAVIANNSAGGVVSQVLGGVAGVANAKFYLSGFNTYTGNTYLDGVTASVLTDRQFGATPTTLGANQLFLTNGANLNYNKILPTALASNRGITLGAGGGVISLGNGYVNLGSTISGTGGLTINSFAGSGVLTLSGPNTFDGVLTLNTGLAYTSIGNVGGGASALGAPTTAWNGQIVINNSLTLAYVGVGAAVSDRMIDFVSSGWLAADGAGSLTLNGNIIEQGLISLSGYGVGIINGNILQSGSAPLGLTKYNSSVNFTNNPGTWQLNGQNTYSGVTTVGNGTLEFNTIGNVGSGASSLGAPTTVANGTIALTGGVLRYTGTTAQSSDRAFSVTVNSGLETTSAAPITFVGGVNLSTFTLTLGGTGAGYLSGAGILSGSGAGGITENGLTGLGVWTLNQSATNSYTGATTVNAGTLNLDFSNLAAPTNLINAVSALKLGGGTLGIIGNATGSTSQTFASLTTTLDTYSVLNLNANGGAGTNFITTTGAWTLGANSTLDIETTGNVTITGSLALIGGVNNQVTVGGTNFATMLTGTTIGAATSYTALTSSTVGSVTSVYQLTGSQTQTVSTSISALKIVPTGSGQSFNLGTSFLTCGQDTMSILFDGSQYAYTITSGSIGLNNQNWNLDFITAGPNALTVASPIVTNQNTGNSSSYTVTKAGAGTSIMSGSQSYKQQTFVEAGTLAAGSVNGFSASSRFNVNAAGILATEGFAPNILSLSGNGIVENGSSSADILTIGANTTNGGYGFTDNLQTFSGVIKDGGAGSLSLVKAGYLWQWLANGYNSMNTYTGSTTVKSGLLGVYTLADSGVASSIGAGNAITLGSFGQLAVLQVEDALSVNNESNRTVTLAAGGAGAIDVQNSSWILGQGGYQTNPNSQNGTLFGALVTLSGNVTGAGQLEKLGTGNLVLSGVNNYTGGTIVDFGILQFSGSTSVPASGLITVNSGGTVGAGYAIDQAFLNHITSTSNGVVALGADSSNSLDFTNLVNAALGANGSYIFTGTLLPGGGTYQLGGGGMVTIYPSNNPNPRGPASVLTIANRNTLTGNNNLVVSPHGSSGGTVLLEDAQNYTGTTTVSGGFNLAWNSLSTGYAATTSYATSLGTSSRGQMGVAFGELDVTGSLSTSAINLNTLGIIKFVASAGSPGQFLPTTTPVNLKGGNFEFVNDGSTANFALSTGTLNLVFGSSEVVAGSAVAGQTSSLTFAGLTRAAGTTVEFSALGLGTSSNQITFTTNSSSSNPTLATPWAFYSPALGTTMADSATDFAIISTSGSVTAANAAYIATAAFTGGDYSISSTGSYILSAGTTSANTIRLIGSAAQTITGGTGTVLAVNGFMTAAQKYTLTIGASVNDGGALTAVGSSGGEIVFDSATNYVDTLSPIVVNTNITNNGGAVSVIKTGYGNLYLNGSNSFSGGLVVNGYGQVIDTGSNGASSLGAGPITMNSGAIVTQNLAANTVIANNWIVNADADLRFDSNVSGVTLSGSMTLNNNATLWLLAYPNYLTNINGPINGTGNFGIQGGGGNPFILGGSANNSFTGTTYITGNPGGGNTTVVSLEKLNTSGSNVSAITGNIVLGQSTQVTYGSGVQAVYAQEILVLNNSLLGSGSLSNEQIAATSLITFQGGNGYDAGVLRLNNQNDTIAGIQSSGAADGLIQNNALAAGTSTLTLQTVSGQTTNFGGILQNRDNATTTGTGILALTVTGAGTQQLSGVSTYSGTTTVTGSGTLIVSGSLTASSVSVNTATATLGGSGGIEQNVTVTNGGHLAPGLHSAGTNFGGPSSILTLASAGTLTLTSAVLDFDLDTTAASANNDKIVAGALSLGSPIVFNFGQLTPGTLEIGQLYTLISANSISGFSAGNISTTWVNGTPYTATYSVVGNNLDVTFTAVPEPGSWAMLVGGFGMLSCFQRLRRNRR